jgi:1,4-dihydroxy-6-naphthoate synthase
MTRPIRLGISTCPNDTFAFHGLLTRAVDWRGLDFQVELLDVETLNERLLAGDFDVCKASFHAALLAAADVVVLPSGSALGFGVGPLLLSAPAGGVPTGPGQLTLCPGRHTTAALLFALFHPHTTRVEHVVFSEIMPMLAAGRADFGVCIHEGRFTWQQHGLGLVEDLGTRWEAETGCPLPLGGIVASRRLAGDTARAATSDEVKNLRHESTALQEVVADLTLENRLLKNQYDRGRAEVRYWSKDKGERGRR